ncbi:DUF6471 domain-containing protein [Paraburkholderia guartelaensis]|uniref:DUF6471 domain-containing protein n=1 Tax=Paraburkholderia guartelaensis TaxID=2546446 RepID=A0ABU9SDJ3_9BURK
MSETLQAKSLTKCADSIDAVWAKLVSRATRVVLARQDMSYAELASALGDIGIAESARSVEGKVARGSFRFAFFLQTLVASNAECSLVWKQTLADGAPWEQRATGILRIELGQQPWLDPAMLSARLEEIGVAAPADLLQSQIETGTFSAALFFQCAAVCSFKSASRYVDRSSLVSTAMAGRRLAANVHVGT